MPLAAFSVPKPLQLSTGAGLRCCQSREIGPATKRLYLVEGKVERNKGTADRLFNGTSLNTKEGRIDGIDVGTAMTVLAEVGVDMSKFPTVKHFAAWLGLCPGTKISGGKVLGCKTQKCAKMDKPKAITAAAHKLARLIYTMITKGEEYVGQGQTYHEERYRQRVEIKLRRKAESLGLRLVPMQAT